MVPSCLEIEKNNKDFVLKKRRGGGQKDPPIMFSLGSNRCDVFQIAAKVAAPLGRTNEIVILSGENSRVTGEVNRLLAELPVTVNALTGVDLTKVKHTDIKRHRRSSWTSVQRAIRNNEADFVFNSLLQDNGMCISIYLSVCL